MCSSGALKLLAAARCPLLLHCPNCLLGVAALDEFSIQLCM
jgi:hypothetical protein